jgi:hypothetical protein
MAAEPHQHNIQAQQLAQALLTEPNEQECQACLDVLEAYVDAQLAEQPYSIQYPQVAGHLDSCVACAESYALVYETRRNEATLPQPAAIPQPDLSFLASVTAIDQFSTLITNAIEWVGSQLRFSFSQALLNLIPPPLPGTLVLRGTHIQPRYDFTIAITGGAISQLRLIAMPSAANSDQCDLQIQLSIPGRDWPDLADILVTLSYGTQQVSATTDAWGEAVFAGVPQDALATMRVDVSM